MPGFGKSGQADAATVNGQPDRWEPSATDLWGPGYNPTWKKTKIRGVRGLLLRS